MNRTPMPRADFFTGLILFILGTGMTIGGAMLPGPAEISYIEVGGEPGKLPIVVGIVIALLAFILLLRAVNVDGLRLSNIGWSGESNVDRVALTRAGLTALGCSFYAVGLISRKIGSWHIPYELATFAFLFLFVLAFEWPTALESAARQRRLLDRITPEAGRGLDGLLAAISPLRRAQIWLAINAALYAILLTIGVTYLFEKQFLVTLP